MPRRLLARVPDDTTLAGHRTRIEIVRAPLSDVEVDRKRRIDDVIDYFGVTCLRIGRDPCGESWLDQARSR